VNAMTREFIDICALTDIAPLGSRVIARAGGNVALFRAADDHVFALLDRCPHKGGPLSQGIVHGHRVTCPLHNWTIELESGAAVAPDQGCARRFEVRVLDGRVLLSAAALGDGEAAGPHLDVRLDIRADTELDDAVVALLNEHQAAMEAVSPPESRHALDRAGLLQPGVTFWAAWSGDVLAGCGALKQLDATHAEVKAMRTSARWQRRGVARVILRHLTDEARRRGYTRLSLETGSVPYFEPARRLYAQAGFTECAPFGDYRVDPNSVYMTLVLD
jgi:putative acetyltransferase